MFFHNAKTISTRLTRRHTPHVPENRKQLRRATGCMSWESGVDPRRARDVAESMKRGDWWRTGGMVSIEENLSERHCVHHKSHTDWPEIEPRPPMSKADD
jgi:hypothetical protein